MNILRQKNMMADFVLKQWFIN